MKISFNWLRELLPELDATPEQVAERLSLSGLEVEGVARFGRDLEGMRVVEVRGVRPHPQADKLRLVRIATGTEESEVVCGAPNVPAAGGRVIWAPPGSVLPGGMRIESREVRGVMSPGMLCSEKELGLSDDASGLLIIKEEPVGGRVGELPTFRDTVLEVNVTANRGDALSHAGVARDVAALFGARWRRVAPDRVPVDDGAATMKVAIDDPSDCPRYLGWVITGLAVAPSPLWMRLRLQRCGVRAISNLVDVTNYVMLELGQPLHAFDHALLRGGIRVRRAQQGERMTTLDAVERALATEDLVIADAERAVALAGVMGGATSEVSDATRAVFLESASFMPRLIRRTAKRLGLHSEASHRFERGVDPNGAGFAAERAATLMARLGGGSIAARPTDCYPRVVEPRRVVLSMAGLARIAGTEIAAAEAASLLQSIELEAKVEGDSVVATVPTFRPDIAIEEDLAEEVLRLRGYDKIPTVLPRATRAPGSSPEALADNARRTLAALGFHEIISWAFVPRAWLLAAARGNAASPLAQPLFVKNPISADYEAMRTTLVGGLLDATRRNLVRGISDVRLSEVGTVVRPRGGSEAPYEPTVVAALMTGRNAGWLKPGEPVDFFDVKHAATELLAALGAPRATTTPPTEAVPEYMHPRIVARLMVERNGDDRAVGWVGELHPEVLRRMDIEQPAFYLEIELDALGAVRSPVKSVAPPRYPAVTRDVSFWVDQAVTAAGQERAFRSAGEPLLREAAVLEDFRDPKYVPNGKKGMLWSMTYRADDRTLTDAEADAAHARVIAALRSSVDIQIR